MLRRDHTSPRRQAAVATAFAAAAFAAAGIGSIATSGTTDSAWFAALERPPWYPPSWAFGTVWTVLYVMIAWSGFLAWRAGAGARAIAIWGGQMALNLAWTLVFFGARRPGWAVLVIALLGAAIVATIDAFHRIDRTASLLLAPYLAWVAFAATLNVAIVMLN